MLDKDTFQKFGELLQLKRYSPNTIKTYVNMVVIFQKFIGRTPIERLNKENISISIIKLIKHKNYSTASHKQLIGALNIFYRDLFNRPIDFSPIYPARKQYTLPEILSKEEVRSIIEVTTNIKHKTIIMTIYALGLRRSELINLNISDIDSKRGVVHIKKGKGSKDRIIPLSKKLLSQLRTYFKIYRPEQFLFCGAKKNKYSAASLRNIFKSSCKKASINKHVTLHSLRHAYATHLMDNGTDVRLIQELLGHNSIKTTMRYTHVTTKSIKNIKSPLDFL